MKEGHYGDEMYILRSGKVKIEKGGKFVVELPSGVVLGELAVLGSDKRRTADVFHEILERFPAAKRVFDHAYVARLVSLEVHNAKEELSYYDTFFGSAMPRTGAQLQEMLGATSGKGDASKNTTAPSSPRKQQQQQQQGTQGLALPSIHSAARRASVNSEATFCPPAPEKAIRPNSARDLYDRRGS